MIELYLFSGWQAAQAPVPRSRHLSGQSDVTLQGLMKAVGDVVLIHAIHRESCNTIYRNLIETIILEC